MESNNVFELPCSSLLEKRERRWLLSLSAIECLLVLAAALACLIAYMSLLNKFYVMSYLIYGLVLLIILVALLFINKILYKNAVSRFEKKEQLFINQAILTFMTDKQVDKDSLALVVDTRSSQDNSESRYYGYIYKGTGFYLKVFNTDDNPTFNSGRYFVQDQINIKRNFLLEGYIGLNISHPNLVKTLECFRAKVYGAKEELCIKLAEIDGVLLQDYIDDLRDGRRVQSIAVGLKIMRQLCEVMVYLHENNLVFRDLKAENIMIDNNNNVVLFDAGLITYRGYIDSAPFGTIRAIGAGSGKPSHPADDIYCLGVIFVELVTYCMIRIFYANLARSGKLKQALKDVEASNWPYSLKNSIAKMVLPNKYKRPSSREILSIVILAQETLQK